MTREIILYKTREGKCPVKDFLDSLPDKVFRKTAWVLRLISELDIVPAQYFKKLSGTDDIWECRIRYKTDTYRLLCFFAGNTIVVLTNGFKKKSQKTPMNEIEIAENFKKDYLRRMK